MSLRRRAWAGLAAVLLGALALRAGLAVHRYYDTDELEHLHAALLVAHGNLPFRDFFEHHGPLFYAALAPVVAPASDPVDKALAGRLFMSLFWLCSLMLVARPRKGSDRLEGVLAAAWLAWFGAFAQKSLEIRPDVPAAFLIVAAAYALSRTERAAAAATGALLGLALWFSPKAVFPAAGLLAGCAWRRRDKRFLIEAALGAAVVVGMGTAYYAVRDGFWSLWRWYVMYNANYPGARVAWDATMRPSLLSDPLMWALGLAGLRRWKERPEEAGALVAGLAALAVTPSGYPQHLLFVAPFLAGFAARELFAWRDRRLAAAALALSLLMPGYTAVRLIRQGNELQRERWRCTSALLPLDAPVFDLWTGDAFHRPHAAYHWFVPDDSQNYYEPAALESQLSVALAARRTSAAIRCESCLKRMPESMTRTFDRYYEPSGCGRLWMRKKGV